mmetsp:Transcript_62319/g.140416  ORF Transcript_62319/g.140416 Transcript_62319/m.140416 type:complete len:342 (+) Transcript_62319:660-1685(+)
MRGFILLDHGAVFVLAHQIGCDKAWAAVHLRNLVRQHVAIVVVARHPKAAAGPPDDLHRRGVADEVHEVAAALVQETGLLVLFLVVSIEDLFHLLPEALLPLEDRLLRNDVGHNICLQATREENVREVLNVVQGIVVDHHSCLVVENLTAINDCRLLGLHVLGEEGRKHATLANALPASTVLAAYCMALEENGPVEAQLDARNMDGVPRDRDAIPAAAHGTIGRTEGLLQAELLDLLRRWRDRRLLEDGTDLLARGNGIVEHLVTCLVTRLAAQVEVLPLRGINEGVNPLLANDLHGVPGHLLPRDVRHRGSHNLLAGKGAERRTLLRALHCTERIQHGAW